MRGRYPQLSEIKYAFGPGPMTPAVKAILIANVAVFVFTYFAPSLMVLLGLRPADLFGKFAVWQPVTYMFVHASLSHIFFNMLTLWLIGVQLERLGGTRYFTKVYFVSGLGAGFTQVLLGILQFALADQVYYPSTVGASGAIFGLLLAFAIYYPTAPFLVFFIFPVPARYFVTILGAISLLLALGGGSGVAHTAHLGGLVTGYLYLKRPRMSSRINIFSEIQYRFLKWRINRMRRKFDVYSGGRRYDWDRNVH